MCNKQCKTMTLMEQNERINTLANALASLNQCRLSKPMANSKEQCPVRLAIENIAKELSKLTQQD
jgi:hypothetical protein